MKSPNVISAFLCGTLCALCVETSAFTPVRPLASLKPQDPMDIVASAPGEAELRIPARYVKAMKDKGEELVALTNALTQGQIILQNQIAYWQNRTGAAEKRAERLDALRSFLVDLRDKAVLPTTKAIYQTIIDKIDDAQEK